MQYRFTPFARLSMTTLRIAAFAAILASASAAEAQGSIGRPFGLGGMVGDPTGLSMKFRIVNDLSIDVGVGFTGWYGSAVQSHADVLWDLPLVSMRRADMNLHWGVGPKVAFWVDDHPKHPHWHDGDADFAIGARAPVGLTWEFNRRPLDVFFEVAAGLWFAPWVGFDLDAAAGARYWF